MVYDHVVLLLITNEHGRPCIQQLLHANNRIKDGWSDTRRE